MLHAGGGQHPRQHNTGRSTPVSVYTDDDELSTPFTAADQNTPSTPIRSKPTAHYSARARQNGPSTQDFWNNNVFVTNDSVSTRAANFGISSEPTSFAANVSALAKEVTISFTWEIFRGVIRMLINPIVFIIALTIIHHTFINPYGRAVYTTVNTVLCEAPILNNWLCDKNVYATRVHNDSTPTVQWTDYPSLMGIQHKTVENLLASAPPFITLSEEFYEQQTTARELSIRSRYSNFTNGEEISDLLSSIASSAKEIAEASVGLDSATHDAVGRYDYLSYCVFPRGLTVVTQDYHHERRCSPRIDRRRIHLGVSIAVLCVEVA